jgi:hypothetical protein
MADVRAVEVVPITDTDIEDVARFLCLTMNSALSERDWCRAMATPWDVDQPNRGFLLRDDGRVVGVYLALYSQRVIDGTPRHICNLGTWCVAEEHRAMGLRLLRSLLRQRGYTFTDLSPIPNVVALNTRLGFAHLDTRTALIVNLPRRAGTGDVRIIDVPGEIDDVLRGSDRTVYRDHVASTAQHVVLARRNESCHVMFRQHRYKRLPVVSVIHVGNRDLFRECAPHFYSYLLLRRRIPASLVETRLVGNHHRPALTVSGPARMYLSDDLEPAQIDYLYSELTCLG